MYVKKSASRPVLALLMFGIWSAALLQANAQTPNQNAATGAVSQSELQARDRRIAELERRLAALEGDQSRAGDAADAPDQLSKPGDDLAERSLERTLVRTGALLLDPGEIELDPSLSYRRIETTYPTIATPPGGGATLASVATERDEIALGATVLFGLPGGFQGEASATGISVRQENVLNVTGSPVAQTISEDSGLGSARVGIAKIVAREGRYTPDVILRAGYTFPIDNRNTIASASTDGFEAWDVNVIAVKRQDPLVFLAGIGYADPQENDGVELGETVSLTGNVYLAVSPETSLWFGLRQSFGDDVKVNNSPVPGSNTSAAVLEMGFSSVISRNASWDIAFDVGLTEDAPDFAVTITTPWRF